MACARCPEHVHARRRAPCGYLPRLGADGASVAILREHCRALGYDAFDWGEGFNTGPQGDLDRWLDGLADRISNLLASHSQPATLIGWSLGGLYARELGKLLAPRVRQVITIGTPFNAEADMANASSLFCLLGGSSTSVDLALSERLRTPPPLRTTPSTADRTAWWRGTPVPRQAVHTRPGYRSRRQPLRLGLEPGGAERRGRPA